MYTFLIRDTQIRLMPDPIRGTQTIAIQDSMLGQRLAAVLGNSELVDGFFILEHDRNVDEIIVALADVLVAMRYNHPGLMQVQYILPGVRK